jgi:hypothetical protein
MKKMLYYDKRGGLSDSLEEDNYVGFCYLRASEIRPDKRGGL